LVLIQLSIVIVLFLIFKKKVKKALKVAKARKLGVKKATKKLSIAKKAYKKVA
jgi:hypothetical protein